MTVSVLEGATGPVRVGGRLAASARRHWLWWAGIALAIVLPWLFYDWERGRQSGFVISMLSQMGLMITFALSYNMLMGQAGLLSFGHAVFMGLAGYATAHILNAAGAGALPVPIELVPLLAGLAGLVFAAAFGYMATKQRSTAFAMITLGIGELVTTASVMFQSFFGGEGGVTTDRAIDHSLLGLTYGADIQVYYLIVAWTFAAALLMWLLTQTPQGRLANACRDNYERAQFIGYDPSMVRFIQFSLSGFFAGIAGGLYAITYEIVTYDAVSATLSANALLMAFIGGSGVFGGPVLGAVLIVLLQSGVSLMSNSWLIYVGVLFIAMVTFAPGGLGGLIMAHRPIWRAGRLGALAVPYLRILVPGLVALAGFVALIELASFVTIGAAQGKTLVLLGRAIDARAPVPWAIGALCLCGGGLWLRHEARAFRRIWDELGAETGRSAP